MDEQQMMVGHRYRIERTLGSGAMGSVYRAVDRLTQQPVALKRVRVAPRAEADASDEEERALLIALTHEFRTLASLRHPNIISVLDYGFDQHMQPFFTMELLEPSMHLLQAAHGLPRSSCLTLLIQALEALAYLHRRGVLHHDLKPENMLVVDGRVRLLDFGLAVLAGQEHRDDTAGTLLYIAPELLDGWPYSPQADLYSLGVLAYELLVGRHPFAADTARSFIARVRNDQPDLSPLADDPALATLVGQFLAKRPEDRPSDARAAIAAFQQILGVAVAGSAAIRESYLQAAAFVGREAELATLDQALHASITGDGSAWLIGGESGAGKSRLLDELRIRALVAGATVVRGQAVEGGGLAYQLWREPLRHLALSIPLTDLEAGVLLELIPDLPALHSRPIRPVPDLPGEPGRQRLVQTIVDVMCRHAEPLVMLAEDLQWADESLAPLTRLQELTHDHPLLIVGAYRADEAPELAEQLTALREIRLERLDSTAIAHLSQAMLGDAGKAPQLVELLGRETEGNVFFLIEVVRALAEEAGDLDRVARMSLPAHVFASGIQKLVRRRIERVPRWAWPLLTLAAAAGREIDGALLTSLAGEQPLDTWLIACADAAILEVLDGGWRFRHDKLRDGVLAILTDEERRASHAQVATALEATYAGDVSWAAVLAGHWAAAGVVEKEASYAATAGRRASDAGLIAEARRLLDRAHEIWSTGAGDSANALPKLLCDLGQLSLLSGDVEQGRQRFEQALALAEAAADRASAGHALDGLSAIAWRAGRSAEACELARQSLAIFRAIDDREGIRLALNDLGTACRLLSAYDEAIRCYEEALAMARTAGDTSSEAGLLSNLGVVSIFTGEYARTQRYYEQSLACARAIGSKTRIALSLNNLGDIAMKLGDDTSARRHLEESLAICRDIGYHELLPAPLINLADIAIREGRLDAARPLLEESISISRTMESMEFLVYGLYALGEQARADARLAEAAEYLHEALQLALTSQLLPLASEILTAVSRWLIDRGQHDLAGVLLVFTQRQPEATAEAHEKARPLFVSLEQSLPPIDWSAVRARADALTWHDVAAMALTP